MSKIVTLLKRKPGLAVEDFQHHLRTVHGAHLAALPGLRRCVLSLPLRQGYARGELLFDAVAEMWFDTADDDRVGETARLAAGDGAPALFEQSRTLVLPVTVYAIKDEPAPVDPFKQVEFITRRPGMELQAFRDYWRKVHGPIAARMPVMARYEQNHVADIAYAQGKRPPFDGLAVMWFQSTEEMKRGAKTPEFAAILADEPNFMPANQPFIIAREHVVVG
jgi:uncharacterized protein (TIGR02118 family)